MVAVEAICDLFHGQEMCWPEFTDGLRNEDKRLGCENTMNAPDEC